MPAGRIGRRSKLKPEGVAAYREWHSKVWPAVLEFNTAAGIRNFSIFLDGTDLFSYFEVDEVAAALARLNSREMVTKWLELMAPLMDAPDPMTPWVDLEEVFHQD